MLGGLILKIIERLYYEEIVSRETICFWKNDHDFNIGFEEVINSKGAAVQALRPLLNMFEDSPSID